MLCAAALFLAGCGDRGGDEATTTSADADGALPPQAVPLTPLEVELVRAGTSPRAVLEHDISPGTEWVGELSFGLAVEGVSTAQVDGESHLEAIAVDDDGTVTADYGLLGLDVAVGAEGAPPVEDALDITGEVVVEADRTVTSATVQTTASGDIPGVEGVAAALDPRLSSLLFPFPAEPIGPGAEWDIRGPLPLFGTVVQLEARARLVRRQGGRFDIAVAVVLTSADDEPGPGIDLTGLGEIKGDVTALGPDEGTIAASGTIVLPDRGPEPRPMTMDVRLTGQ